MTRFFLLLLSAGWLISSSQINSFKQQAEKLKNSSDMKHGILGVCVIDVKKDSVVFSMNAETGLVPASSLKIVTTAAAMSILGENFRYETKLEYDGELDSVSGVVKGNLYIKGSGDPTLDSKFFRGSKDTVELMEQWAKIIAKKGIKKIEGAVIADASCFEDEMIPNTWIWADMGNYFGAGACGLNFKDNLYTVYFKTNGYGDSASITEIRPQIPGLNITSYVRAGGSTDNAYIYGAPYDYERYVTGTVPPNRTKYEVDGSIPDPAWLCAYSLDSALRVSGIETGKKPVTVRQLKLLKEYKPSERKKLHSHFSPSLSQIIFWTNRRSINLYAECLLKTIALKKNGLGTENGGTDAVASFWQSKGVSTSGMYLNDGCGLSRWNSVSAKQLAQILNVCSKESWYKSFYSSLPQESEDIAAKSGYITRVRSYAGYVKKKNGELVCFAIIANNYDCSALEIRSKLEQLMFLIPGL